MTSEKVWALIVLAASLLPFTVFAQERVAGTAIVRVADNEYTIPIECNDASRPELGFSTEPGRVTQEQTGRTSGVRLTVRPWKETTYLVISLDKYVAWVPSRLSSGGVLRMTLAMSPASYLVDGVPRLLTYDDWMAGIRPAGLDAASFEANCRDRNPDAPAFRKVSETGRDRLWCVQPSGDDSLILFGRARAGGFRPRRALVESLQIATFRAASDAACVLACCNATSIFPVGAVPAFCALQDACAGEFVVDIRDASPATISAYLLPRRHRPAYEPGSTLSTELGLGAFIELSESWRILFELSAERLDDAVRNSPIVDDGTVLKGFGAITYVF